MSLNDVQPVLFGLLLGAVVALIWADVVSVLRVVRGTQKESTSRFAGIAPLVPRWLAMMVVVTGACTVLVGAFQVVQASQFSSYVECERERTEEYDLVQAERAQKNFEERKANAEVFKAAAVVFRTNSPEDQAAFQRALNAYLKVSEEYIRTVQDNPYPRPVAEVCE